MLFLGAGVSYQFGKPTTKGFKEKLEKENVDPIIKSFLDTPGFQDIEHVLQAMKEVRLCMAPAGEYQYAGKYLLGGKAIDSETGDFTLTFKKIRKTSSTLENWISEKIFEEYDWDDKHNNDLLIFYKPLFELLTGNSDETTVVTTNYDQAIEKFGNLPSGYSCIDGFYPKNGKNVWAPENYSKVHNIGADKKIFLYKIHGSLNWIHDGSPEIVKTSEITFDGPSGSNIYIAPTISPKDHIDRPPYNTFIEEFKKNLQNSDVCVVIGFSFRDDYVNDKFKEIIKSGKHLIIISPHCQVSCSENLYKNKNMKEDEHIQWCKTECPKNIHFIQNYVDKENNPQIFQDLKKVLDSI